MIGLLYFRALNQFIQGSEVRYFSSQVQFRYGSYKQYATNVL